MNSIKFARDKYAALVRVGDTIEWHPTDHHSVPGVVSRCREDGLIEATIVNRGLMVLRPQEFAVDSSADEQSLRTSGH